MGKRGQLHQMADVSVNGRGEFSWKTNASAYQLSVSQRLLALSAQRTARCCVVVAINKCVMQELGFRKGPRLMVG
jgi:hypothetical protein